MEMKQGLCDWCSKKPAITEHGLVIHAAYLRGRCAAWGGNEPTQVCAECAEKIVTALKDLWKPIPLEQPTWLGRLLGMTPSPTPHWDRDPSQVICDGCGKENLYCSVAYIFEYKGTRVDLSVECAAKKGILTALLRKRSGEPTLWPAEGLV